MKRILFTFLFLLAFMAGYTQINNNGGIITVESGAVLVIEGDYTSSSSGDIEIDGTVQLKGHFVNNSGTVNSTSIGTLAFVGTSAQEIKGTAPTDFGCNVEINNAAGVSITTANQVMSKNLTFTSGKLTLGAYDLTLAATSAIAGAGSGNYAVTSGAGLLKRPVGATDVAFPVGAASTYNPLVLNNIGTSDTYGVRFDGTMPSGWTGTDHAVTGHWTVTENVATGSDLTVTTQWNLVQEQASFVRTDCAVGLQISGDDVNWAASGAASGTDPYYMSGAGFDDVGNFLVGDAFYLFITLDLDMFLAGPFASGSMSNALYTNGLIPTTDPYLGTIVGSIPANAVDWILVEFRNQANSAQVDFSRAYFVDINGNVLNTDGSIGAKVSGVPKASYYIAVKHRNHLGVMTASVLDLSVPNPSFNFTAGTGVYGTNPMRNMGSVYALWAGNTDGNGSVQFATGTSDITPISNAVVNDINNLTNDPTYIGALVYSSADADMNGTVQFATGTSDITPVSASVLGNPANNLADPTVVLLQQLP